MDGYRGWIKNLTLDMEREGKKIEYEDMRYVYLQKWSEEKRRKKETRGLWHLQARSGKKREIRWIGRRKEGK